MTTGGRALLGGSVVLVAILAFLLYQLQSSASPPTPAPAAAAPKVATAAPPQIAPSVAAQMAALGDAPVQDPNQPHKYKPQSDEFFTKFDDLQPSMLMRTAISHARSGAR